MPALASSEFPPIGIFAGLYRQDRGEIGVAGELRHATPGDRRGNHHHSPGTAVACPVDRGEHRAPAGEIERSMEVPRRDERTGRCAQRGSANASGPRALDSVGFAVRGGKPIPWLATLSGAAKSSARGSAQTNATRASRARTTRSGQRDAARRARLPRWRPSSVRCSPPCDRSLPTWRCRSPPHTCGRRSPRPLVAGGDRFFRPPQRGKCSACQSASRSGCIFPSTTNTPRAPSRTQARSGSRSRNVLTVAARAP